MNRRTFMVATGTMIAGSASAANETLRVAVVGSGGRARHLLKSFPKLPNVEVTHVCDLWHVALTETLKLVPKAKPTNNQKEIWDNKDIDAVLIASPDHWHVPMTIAAVAAGKDVYVEKPMTHDAKEGQAVIDAVAKSKCIVQVGMQQRSMPHIIEAKKLIAGGKLGTLVKADMSWNRNSPRGAKSNAVPEPFPLWKMFLGSAPDQPFDDYKRRNWRFFWDFGGGIFTDLMVHWIDVAHWLMDVDTPSRAVSVGNFVKNKDVWETPDTVQCLLTYPKNIQMRFEGTFSNATRGAHCEIQGTDGTIYLDRGRMVFTPEKTSKAEAISTILGKIPSTPGADFYDQPDAELLHLTNWLDCIRTRKEPAAPIRAGVTSAAAAHLANTALRGNGVANG